MKEYLGARHASPGVICFTLHYRKLMNKLNFDENRAFHLLKEQMSFGPRFVGTETHKKFQDYLAEKLSPLVNEFHPHIFREKFWNKEVTCKNIGGLIYGRNRTERILLGSHFDTRPFADNDPEPQNWKKPVPGANDGASGIAVMLELARLFSVNPPEFDVEMVFFDAEDWNNIDGKEVSLGAHCYVRDNINNLPDRVIIVDMVGGKNLQLDIDLHCFLSDSSKKIKP